MSTRAAGTTTESGAGARGKAAARGGESGLGDGVLAEVFLSPRVIDEGAFHEFAATLRALVEHAAATSEAVRATAEEAEQIGKKLSESGRAHQSRLDLSGKLLAAIDQRAKDAEALAAKASGLEALAASLEGESGELAERHARALRARLEDELRAVESRAGAVKAGWSAGAANVRAHLDEALKQGEARVQAAAAAAREHAGEIERELGAAVRAGRETAAGLAAELERAGEAARGSIDRAAGEALARLGASQEQIIGALDGRLARLEALCARADAVLGGNGVEGEGRTGQRAEGAGASIGGVMRRVDAAREAAEFSVRQFDALRGQADQCRSDLGEWLAGSSELLDSVGARKLELERSLHHVLGLCHAADTTLRGRAAEVRQLLDSRLGEVKREAMEAVTTLRAAAERCAELRGETETALVRNADALERLGRLSAQLEPWRGVLETARSADGAGGEGKGEEDLPEPLARAVAAARRAVTRDLARIAEAIAGVARMGVAEGCEGRG